MRNFNDLEELIRKGRIEEFCQKVIVGLEEVEQSELDSNYVAPLKKGLLVLSSSYYELADMDRSNRIDLEQYSIRKSKIISGLIDILNESKLLKIQKEIISQQIGGVFITNSISEPIGMIHGLSGVFHGNTILISSQIRKLTFGRGNDQTNTPNDVFIGINDLLLSRSHCKIRINPVEGEQPSIRRNYEWRILDLASSNGTYVNGKEVRRNENGDTLENGDSIQVGSSTLLVKIFNK